MQEDPYICITIHERSVRLVVRTPDFHSGSRGSTPLRSAIQAAYGCSFNFNAPFV